MMIKLYTWTGIDTQGQYIVGRTHSNSETTLKYTLYQQKIAIRKIETCRLNLLNLHRWHNSKQTLFFLTQLHSLLKIGLNLSKAADLLAQNQTKPLVSELMSCLKYQLAQGQKLSSILKLFPELFDSIILQLIESGEATGRIDLCVQQAVQYYGQKQQTLNQLLTALLYPALLFLVSLAVLTTLIIFVIPQFESIYSQSKAELPSLTVIILNISNWFSHNFKLLCLGIFILTVTLILSQRSHQIQWIDYIPVVGKTVKKINTLRFCQTITSLYSSGLNITDCLSSCRNLSSSHPYQKAIHRILSEIKNGHTLAEALTSSQYFDNLMIQLVKTGEESANLGSMLELCSQYYDDQLKNSFDRLKIMLEPLLIVTLGTIIGVILIAMYLPVFNLGSSF